MDEKEYPGRGKSRWSRRVLQLFVFGIVLMIALSMTATRPKNLGIIAGELYPLPSSPNGVSSYAKDESKKLPPIAIQGTVEEAMSRLVRVINETPRTKIVAQTGDYLYVEFTSLIFRFVDDVEFLIDRAENVIHFRSASRVGYSDLGANKKRMLKIKERFNQ